MVSTGIETEKDRGKEYIRLGCFHNVEITVVDNLGSWGMGQIFQIALQKTFKKHVQPLWTVSLGFLNTWGWREEVRSLKRYYASS